MSDLVGDVRHLSPSAQEALRLRAVAALLAGQDREDVAAVFAVSLKTVDGWWAKWQAGGRKGWSCIHAASRSGCTRYSGRQTGRRAAGGPRSPAAVTWGFRSVVDAAAGG